MSRDGDPVVRLAKIAARQRSVFTAEQALKSGFSTSAIKRRVAAGRWIRLYRGVFVDAPVAIGWPQRAMGAWLACGPRSVLSHRVGSAVWAWRDDVDAMDVTIASTSDRAHPGIRVHRSIRLDAVSYLGFRVTSPMRTLLDLASIEREDRLARFLDVAHRRRLVDLERFGIYLAEPFAASRPGSGLLRAMVEARAPKAPIESDAETLLIEALRMGNIPLPQPQHWLTTRRRRCRIDFAYPEARLAIEVDGWTNHRTRAAFESDRARQNELVEAGWRIVRFTWLQLTTAPVEVMITVGRSLGLIPARWKDPRYSRSR